MKNFIALFVTLIISANVTAATYLIDTGKPRITFAGYPIYDRQWLAEKFAFPTGATIGRIDVYANGSGVLDFVVYDDDAGAPGAKLFRTTVGDPYIDTGNKDIYISSGKVSWALNPGEYWLAFETLDVSGFGAPFDAPHSPSLAGATRHAPDEDVPGYDYSYHVGGPLGIGVRVASVPEISQAGLPQVIAFLLCALAWFRRRLI